MQANHLIEILHNRAIEQRDRIAYRFLQFDTQPNSSLVTEQELTYQALLKKAQIIAVQLLKHCRTGDRVLLLLPPGLEFIYSFLGCLYAGRIAVPTYLPRARQKLYPLRVLIKDADIHIVLTTKTILSRLQNQWQTNDPLSQLRWLIVDQLDPVSSSDVSPKVKSDSLAFLQYTSGSTANPKGVMVSHDNLMANLEIIHQKFGHSVDSHVMTWLPPYHDMGLIGGILQPLFGGFPVTLMSPIAFLQRPIRWIEAISSYRTTTSGGPNFAYELCIKHCQPEQIADLDLSCWTLAFNGAEQIRAETMERFTKTFASYGFQAQSFYPCYGLAETTLFATGGSRKQHFQKIYVNAKALKQNKIVSYELDIKETDISIQTFVGCGQSAHDHQLIIVNPDTRKPCPSHHIGEIWLAGASITQGYWQQPKPTQENFGAYLAVSSSTTPPKNDVGPFLRTGDLGFIHNGELFVTGRLKEIITIRGRNYYPQDLELTVEQSHPALRAHASAAFLLEATQTMSELVIVCEVNRTAFKTLQADEVIQAIHRAVSADHGLRIHQIILCKPGQVPKTTSGKIQRYACRDRIEQLAIIAQSTAPASDPTTVKPITKGQAQTIEAWILQWLQQWLGYDITPLQTTAALTEYGLDSLKAAEFVRDLQIEFGYALSLEDLWTFNTIQSLAEFLGHELAFPNHRSDSTETPPEYYRVQNFPEYQQLQQRLRVMQQLQVPNPYFSVHEQHATPVTQVAGQSLINYCSYDYLGMTTEPRVTTAAKAAIEQYGTSVSASRLASGERPLHQSLEQELAQFLGVDDCLVYVSGHATNVTTIGHLLGPKDLILYDALSHNSIVQGCILSGARALSFPHNDWHTLDSLLSQQRTNYRRVLIAIEGLYSMDGDIPNLPEFVAIKERHKALLMVDEAHSLGVLGKQGRGIGEYFGIQPQRVDLWMGTLSKSLASCGGYIAGNQALVEYLKYTAPGFVYSVGLPPANAAASLAALQLLKAEPQRVATLNLRGQQFLQLAQAQGLATGASQGTSIIPIIIGDTAPCFQLSHQLNQQGINVQPMVHPAVPDGAARLRFFLSCTHTAEQIEFTVDAIAKAIKNNLAASITSVTTRHYA